MARLVFPATIQACKGEIVALAIASVSEAVGWFETGVSGGVVRGGLWDVRSGVLVVIRLD